MPGCLPYTEGGFRVKPVKCWAQPDKKQGLHKQQPGMKSMQTTYLRNKCKTSPKVGLAPWNEWGWIPKSLEFYLTSFKSYCCCCYCLVAMSFWLFVASWTVAHQASPSRQEYWSGLTCSPPGDLPDPGMDPALITSPSLTGRFFITSTTWEALYNGHVKAKSSISNLITWNMFLVLSTFSFTGRTHQIEVFLM